MSPTETVASPRLAGVVDHQQFTRQLPADRKWALGLQVGRLLNKKFQTNSRLLAQHIESEGL